MSNSLFISSYDSSACTESTASRAASSERSHQRQCFVSSFHFYGHAPTKVKYFSHHSFSTHPVLACQQHTTANNSSLHRKPPVQCRKTTHQHRQSPTKAKRTLTNPKSKTLSMNQIFPPQNRPKKPSPMVSHSITLAATTPFIYTPRLCPTCQTTLSYSPTEPSFWWH